MARAKPIERELTREQFEARHPGVKLQHGGKRNKCVGDGEHVFLCFDCNRWSCECCGSDDELPDEPLCDSCWCAREKRGANVSREEFANG